MSSRSTSRPAARFILSRSSRPATRTGLAVDLRGERALAQVLVARRARDVLDVQEVEATVLGHERHQRRALEQLRIGHVDRHVGAQEVGAEGGERLAQAAQVEEVGPRDQVEVARGAAVAVRLDGDPAHHHVVHAVLRQRQQDLAWIEGLAGFLRHRFAPAARRPSARSRACRRQGRLPGAGSARRFAGRAGRPRRSGSAAAGSPSSGSSPIETMIARSRGQVTSSSPLSMRAMALWLVPARSARRRWLSRLRRRVSRMSSAGVMMPYTVSARRERARRRSRRLRCGPRPWCEPARGGARWGYRG